MSTLSERIRKLRKSKGYTQEQMAKIFNVDRSTATGWETGKSKPSFETASKIADHFGITTDYLLYGKITPETAKQLEDEFNLLTNPEGKKLMEKLYALASDTESISILNSVANTLLENKKKKKK